MSHPTIPEMVHLVKPGEQRVFPRVAEPTGTEGRFLPVAPNYEYDPSLMKWRNSPGENAPRPAKYKLGHIPLSSMPELLFGFIGPKSELLDFYHFGEKLYRLIEAFDPDALEAAPVSVGIPEEYGGGDELYWAVIPARVLDSVDATRTNVGVSHSEFVPGRYNVKVFFVGGVTLREDIPADVHAYQDYYWPRWLWSEALLAAARDAGVRGLSADDPSKLHVRPTFSL